LTAPLQKEKQSGGKAPHSKTPPRQPEKKDGGLHASAIAGILLIALLAGVCAPLAGQKAGSRA